jgi:hypothetical protein
MGWIPQEILTHSSIGGSLFHSAGWGSAIETLQFGNNLVLLPFIVDQLLNAKAFGGKAFG